MTISPDRPPLSVQVERTLATIDRSKTALGVSGVLVQDLGRFVYQNGPAIVAALKTAEAAAATFPPRWKLKPGHQAVLRALLERASLKTEAIQELYGSNAQPRRVIFDLRARLAELAPGVAIQTWHGSGCFISAEHKERLRQAIAGAIS